MNDGDIIEMQGSGKSPYQLKRTGEVYSCSCPAWRNQSQPINKRTCKHLRKLLGDAHEQERIGGSLIASRPTKSKVTAVAPALMLAERWDPSIDPTGYLMSEKLDGVRAYWNGEKFISRLGNEFYPPAWYTAKFPKDKLDGELWMGRGRFQETVSIVRTQGLDKEWRGILYRVYDCLNELDSRVETRVFKYQAIVWQIKEAHVQAVEQTLCTGYDHLYKMLAEVEEKKGEGIMLRVAGSVYEGKRSDNLLKVKSFLDGEAIITGYEDGKGNRKGMVGALIVEGEGDFKGKKFNIGTGLTHKILKNPPAIGTKITFKYAKGALSDDGLPKPAVYVGEAIDK